MKQTDFGVSSAAFGFLLALHFFSASLVLAGPTAGEPIPGAIVGAGLALSSEGMLCPVPSSELPYSTITLSSVLATSSTAENNDDVCISEEEPFFSTEAVSSSNSGVTESDAIGMETTPGPTDNPPAKKCVLFMYQDFPECETVQPTRNESLEAFAVRCDETPAVTNPYTNGTTAGECSIRFVPSSSAFLECRSRFFIDAELAIQRLKDPDVATKYPYLAIYKDYLPILVRRGTAYDEIAKLLKANNCASPSRQVSFGHGQGIDKLASHCINSMKAGVNYTHDTGCNTFRDRKLMMASLKEMQKKLEPGQGLAISAQQLLSSSDAVLGNGESYSSTIQCAVNPGSIKCIPSYCSPGHFCHPGSATELPAICTVYGGPNKPNTLGCKECVESNLRASTGVKMYVWKEIPPQADGSISPSCGYIPPEFVPVGS